MIALTLLSTSQLTSKMINTMPPVAVDRYWDVLAWCQSFADNW